MSKIWEELVEKYKDADIMAPNLKAVTLAQWILESARGTSDLAIKHFNFGGLKFRAEMVGYAEPVDYEAHDGLDTYCGFASVDQFITGYWRFISRSVYSGWEDYSEDPAGYIRFLKSKGYAGDPDYVSKVLSLLDEAEDLLGMEEQAVSKMLTRVAVVVGHNSKAQGAYAVSPLSTSEFDYNNDIADLMVQYAPEYNCVAKRFNRIASGSYSKEIKRVYAEADAWKPTVITELHFNALNSTSHGTETLVGDFQIAKMIAASAQEEMIETLGLKDRGVKIRSPSERGGRSLHASQNPTILVEPFFGSNKNDCVTLASIGKSALARCYLRGLRSGLSQFMS
ncbi:MAG: glucosaminidase domain-containing protein [Pseudomonadota bacterium]